MGHNAAMRVSVIATVYNERATIGRLLDSLAAQSRRPDEVVICDGGSSDDTVMLTDGKSRNGPLVWSRDGGRIAFLSTRRNGASNDIWMMDVDKPESAEIVLESPDGTNWSGVDFSPDARRNITQINNWGLSGLSICIAKTQYSISADANRLGRPTGFRVNVREVRAAAGAGFLIVYAGSIRTMPGLPSESTPNVPL